MSLKDKLSSFWQSDFMAEESEQRDVDKLKVLVENNTQAIEKLHEMIENMEVLLLSLPERKKSAPAKAKEQRPFRRPFAVLK